MQTVLTFLPPKLLYRYQVATVSKAGRIEEVDFWWVCVYPTEPEVQELKNDPEGLRVLKLTY